jgi:hypothetical protein
LGGLTRITTAVHHIQLAIRERAMVVERDELRSVVGLIIAHGFLLDTIATIEQRGPTVAGAATLSSTLSRPL